MLKKFQKNKARIAIGLLSGTSVDGIDAAIVLISGNGIGTKINVLDFETYKISPKLKASILRNSHIKTARVDEICRLNAILGKLFAEAALSICKKNHLKPADVDFIGSHGQTVHHLPDERVFSGYKAKSTLQIGDPSVIAALTGIVTVGDFRTADTAVGGDGAPLVPYLDYILFSSKTQNRALLNVGGISNITLLPKGCRKVAVRAFDTGPGNMLIDSLMKEIYRKDYDKDGKIASKGKINEKLIKWLKSDHYYKQKPPKSTGREYYGTKFVENLLKIAGNTSKEDIIRTVTEFTPYSIWYNYENFLQRFGKIDELIISGGGAKNPIISDRLSYYFKRINIKHINKFGIDVDNKEAVLFAVLANECLAGNSANMPSVTGAKRNVVLGKICQ